MKELILTADILDRIDEYGWLPIASAPEGFNKQLIRSPKISMTFGVCISLSRLMWEIENGEVVFATEWYNFPPEEKK